MGFSYRSFLLDDQDRIYRLPLSRFVAMLDNPDANAYPQLASRRVRCADVIVQLAERRPARIVRIVYPVLAFDENGVLKKELYQRQAVAQASLYFNPVSTNETGDANVLDGETRFVASGGQWKPAPALEARLYDAVLGKLKCPRI